ncbi:HAD family hydrolase [Paenibacillus xylanexedens]|uniref:HAD family hydrolase n=1 Tax=Paenibacillus xylanexedens TaxID=528191 RepID=UPI0011AA0058|nr:HAD family hydrolase [Paenibacillus xylanexedens]
MTDSISSKTDFMKVRDFQKAFNCPAPEVPTPLSDAQAMNRASFSAEEGIELLFATAMDREKFKDMYKEFLTRLNKSYEKQLKKEFPPTKLIGQVDALIDQKYFAEGGLVETGVIPDAIFNHVHEANMGKIWDDGKAHYDEYGKIIKPANWEKDYAPEPKIAEEITRQIELGASRFN